MNICTFLRSRTFWMGIFLATGILSHTPLQAQDEVIEPTDGGRRVIIGGLNIEDTSAVKVSPYERKQSETIEYFTNAQKVLEGLSQGTAGIITPITENIASHLNAVYLYCTIKQGACPAVLDALLELDIALSKLSNTQECPNLTKFWKSWLRDDFENRQQFLVKTGFLQVTSEFTAQQRPKYVSCKPTVVSVVQGSAATTPFYRERFAAGSPARTNFDKVTRLLTALRDIPNILTELERRG